MTPSQMRRKYDPARFPHFPAIPAHLLDYRVRRLRTKGMAPGGFSGHGSELSEIQRVCNGLISDTRTHVPGSAALTSTG